MYIKQLSVALLLGVLTLGASDNANANERHYYETRICAGCDYNDALATAAQIKPAINCTGGDDPFNPNSAQAQQCFATPIKILVVDANNRNMWHFENTYTNQGQPLYNLNNEVNYHSLIPSDAVALVNQLLDIYKKIDELAVEFNDRWNAGEFDSITNATTYAVRSTQTDSDPCEGYEYSDALKAAFSDEMKNFLQVSMQEKMEASSGLLGSLSDIKLVNLNFNIGNSITAVGGTWKFSRNSEQIKRIYGDGSVNKRTQVGFIVSMNDGVVRLKLHDDLTYFNGLSLRDLKSKTYSAASINECLGKALDSALPKVVASPTSSSPGYGNIPLIGSGGGHNLPSGSGGGGSGGTTCKHTYYMNGVEIMSFEGNCP